jgi:hypothetical protein
MFGKPWYQTGDGRILVLLFVLIASAFIGTLIIPLEPTWDLTFQPPSPARSAAG